MAEALGILLLCATGLVCVVLPCLAWLAFMALALLGRWS